MNIADLIAEYGAYYINEGQNAQRMVKQLYYENDLDQHFTIRETSDTLYRASSSSFSRILQPFQKTWSPTGEATFLPEPIQTFKVKADIEMYPDEISESWLGWLASENQDRKTWPLVRWLIEEHIIPKSSEDLILNEAYAGVYAAPGTPGTAGAAGTAMNGIKHVINTHIDSGRITPFTIGAWDTIPEDFVTQLESEFVEAIDERYQRVPMTLMMNTALFNRFRAGQAKKYNMNYAMAELDSFFLFPNIKVVGTEAIGSSQKVWCTRKLNQLAVWKHGINKGRFEIESEDRKVKLFNDYHKGYGFLIPEEVFTNDLEPPTP